MAAERFCLIMRDCDKPGIYGSNLAKVQADIREPGCNRDMTISAGFRHFQSDEQIHDIGARRA
ncbi:hypothetical protein, partial [Thiolapillus sp.]|uniref:hypothetical protein n=1 Tax=Thiolapillus sp. TaxID=2017437 RepID=UPI003AF57056